MTFARGFPPISRPDARILILGSMPSRESLARQQYYAHPRNAFWPILADLLSLTAENYEARCRQVTERGVAVWDVLQACFRDGSLDADIDESSMVTNDFSGYLAGHPRISDIFFNGAKAEAVYRKHVLQHLPAPMADICLQRLPSTSPAHAAMSLQRKTVAWRVILKHLGFQETSRP